MSRALIQSVSETVSVHKMIWPRTVATATKHPYCLERVLSSHLGSRRKSSVVHLKYAREVVQLPLQSPLLPMTMGRFTVSQTKPSKIPSTWDARFLVNLFYPYL